MEVVRNLQGINQDFEKDVVRIRKTSGLWKEIGKLLYFAGFRKDCGGILEGCWKEFARNSTRFWMMGLE